MDYQREREECRKLGERAYRDGYGQEPGRKFIPYYKLAFSDGEVLGLVAAYRLGWRDAERQAQENAKPWGWERMMSQ